KFETDINAALELSPHRVQVRPKPGYLRASLNVWATLRQHKQLCFRDVQMPDQEFALGAQQSDCEGSRTVGRMCFVAEQFARNLQVDDGGVVGRRAPRTPAGRKIDGNDPLALYLARNSGDAAVQLVGDDVELLARLVRSHVSCQRHADTKMQG